MERNRQDHAGELVTAGLPPSSRRHLLLGNYLRFFHDPLRVATETSGSLGLGRAFGRATAREEGIGFAPNHSGV